MATEKHNVQEKLRKFFCLLEELETSRELLKSGFGHLQEIDMGNTFYYLPHQLMASGLERFMKCYITPQRSPHFPHRHSWAAVAFQPADPHPRGPAVASSCPGFMTTGSGAAGWRTHMNQ